MLGVEEASLADIFPIRPEVEHNDPYKDEKAPPRRALAKHPNFSLGSTFVLPSRLTLEGPLGSVKIEPRMMEVLIAFADANGAVLTRADLMTLCWPGVTVGDDSVNRVIGGLRKAAVEVGPGFTIETVSRIGYRLEQQNTPTLNDSKVGEGDPKPDALAVDPEREQNLVSSSVRRRLFIGGAAAISVSGIAYWFRPSGSKNVVDAASLIEKSKVVMRAGTPPTDRQAAALLEQAVEIEPMNAEALGLLALTRARMDEHASPDKAVLPATTIELSARSALQLDPDNADAKAALAIAIPYYGDWLAAERRFDAVLEQHPNHLVARTSRAFLLGAVGRMRESAQQHDLFSTGDSTFDAHITHRHIYALWFLDRIDEADRVANRGLQMWPGNYGIWFARLWVLSGTGRFDRALAQINDESARPPLPLPMVENLRMAMKAAMSKVPSEFDQAVIGVLAGVQKSVAAVVNAMMLLNLLGAIDQAFALARGYYLEQGPIIAAAQSQSSEPIIRDQRRRKTNMLFTPVAAMMRSDPRFMPLVQEMGLLDYWNRRGIGPDFLGKP